MTLHKYMQGDTNVQAVNVQCPEPESVSPEEQIMRTQVFLPPDHFLIQDFAFRINSCFNLSLLYNGKTIREHTRTHRRAHTANPLQEGLPLVCFNTNQMLAIKQVHGKAAKGRKMKPERAPRRTSFPAPLPPLHLPAEAPLSSFPHSDCPLALFLLYSSTDFHKVFQNNTVLETSTLPANRVEIGWRVQWFLEAESAAEFHFLL